MKTTRQAYLEYKKKKGDAPVGDPIEDKKDAEMKEKEDVSVGDPIEDKKDAEIEGKFGWKNRVKTNKHGKATGKPTSTPQAEKVEEKFKLKFKGLGEKKKEKKEKKDSESEDSDVGEDFGANSPELVNLAAAGDAAGVKNLLDKGAHPDSKVKSDQYALLSAVHGKHEQVVRHLLDAGADPDVATANKQTPLMFAAAVDSLPIANALLQAGADVEKVDLRGRKALNAAKSTEMKKILTPKRK